MGDPPIWTQEDVPTFRDHINVAKNLLQLLQGARPGETGVVTWSRSGVLAIGMNSGRTAQLPPTAIVPSASNPDTFQALTPRTGGNYNTPYVPGSGTLADWFVVRSGVEAAFIPQPPDGHTEYFDMLPDPDYPVSAPMTYIIGEIDHSDIFINGYYLANAIAAALPGSKLQDKDINSWLRLYTLRGATHAPREAWFAGASDGGGKTWFESGGAGYNHKGRGLELPAWADALRANNPGIDLDWMGSDYAATLPEEGFALQAIANAERWAKTGSAPPTSAVDANLVTDPTPSTSMVTYPVAEDCTAEAIFGAGDLSCLQALKADSVINDPEAGLGELDPVFVGMLQTFAAGPLRTTTSPIDLPGNAAPLGFRLFTPAARVGAALHAEGAQGPLRHPRRLRRGGRQGGRRAGRAQALRPGHRRERHRCGGALPGAALEPLCASE